MGCRGHLSRKTGGEGGDASHRQRPRRRREIKPAPQTVSQQFDDDPNNIPPSPQRDAYWVAQFKSERNREAERERSNCFCAVDLSFPYSPLPFPVSFLLLLPASERRATSSSSHVFTCALSVGPDKLPSFSFSSPAPVHLPTIFFCGCCCCCRRCCCSSCPRIAR